MVGIYSFIIHGVSLFSVFLNLANAELQRQEASLTGRPTTIEQKRFQDFLNSMGLILNSIQGYSTNLCLKKEAVGL